MATDPQIEFDPGDIAADVPPANRAFALAGVLILGVAGLVSIFMMGAGEPTIPAALPPVAADAVAADEPPTSYRETLLASRVLLCDRDLVDHDLKFLPYREHERCVQGEIERLDTTCYLSARAQVYNPSHELLVDACELDPQWEPPDALTAGDVQEE